jgi:hypothetical protein
MKTIPAHPTCTERVGRRYRGRDLHPDAPADIWVILTGPPWAVRWRLRGWGMGLIEDAPIAGWADDERAALHAAATALGAHLGRQPMAA